jgi:hypothetical protein
MPRVPACGDDARRVHAPARRRDRAPALRDVPHTRPPRELGPGPISAQAPSAASCDLRARAGGRAPPGFAPAGVGLCRGADLAAEGAAAGGADAEDRDRSLRRRPRRPPAPAARGSPTRRSAAVPRSGSSAPRRAKRRPRTRSSGRSYPVRAKSSFRMTGDSSPSVDEASSTSGSSRPWRAGSWGRSLPSPAPAANSASRAPPKTPDPLVPASDWF